MEQKLDIQQFVNVLDPFFERKIQEAHEVGRQSGKKESSDLAADVTKKVTDKIEATHGVIVLRLDSIDQKQATANGYVAKHEQRLNTQDVMNATTASSLQNVVTTLDKIVKSEEENTTYRIQAKTTVDNFKWLLGIGLFGQLGMIILFVAKFVMHLF